MHLEMRFEANGDVRPIWYGRFMVNGKRQCVNLGVKLQGSPPASRKLRDLGDPLFEQSRGMARERLKEVAAEARSVRDSARLVEKLYAIKTGAKVRAVRLVDLAREWEDLPRKRAVAGQYATENRKILQRFVEFVRSRDRKAEELAYVSPEVATAFMRGETARGVSARTWNGTLKLLRSTFRRLLPTGAPNPFERLVGREGATVFRQPFTPAELKSILDAAQEDNFIRPIIVTGMCTAMRRGDCCLLRWKDADLERGFVTVKTAKTGGTVSIPIFGLLREELEKRAASRKQKADKTEFVFPDQAAMYEQNPDGITKRVKRVLWTALAGKGDEAEMTGPGAKAETVLAEVSLEELRRRGDAFLSDRAGSEKSRRMRAVLHAYTEGKAIAEAASSAGVSKGAASAYLNEIEQGIGCKVLRWRARERGVAKAVREDDALLRTKRVEGVRRASVRDFHSLRVTWVTLALTAGVALELVQRVTGHKTTDVVLKHYFRPGQEDFRQALEGAMPKLLTVGTEEQKLGNVRAGLAKAEIEVSVLPAGKTAKEEMREMLNEVKPKALRERLLKVWEKW